MTDESTTPEQPLASVEQHEEIPQVRIAGYTIWQTIGAILATLALLWALDQASAIVGMVAISFFFSLALEPLVRKLVARFAWRRGAAVGVIYLAGFLFVFLMVAVLIPAIAALAESIGENGAQWIANINEFTEDTFGWTIADQVAANDLAEGAESGVAGFSDEALGALLSGVSTGINLIFTLATVAMFTFYFTADGPRVQSAVLRLFSPRAQERIGWTWDQAIVQTGGYFYSRMILFFINGIGFFFTMVLVGVPTTLAIALAIFGGFVSVFIPAIGTYIGGAIPVLLTAAIQGLTAGLIVLGYVLAYQQLENYWLSPKISSGTMELNGGVAFGAALAGGAIAGPMGAFTALPVAALITAFLKNYVVSNELVYHSDGTVSAQDGTELDTAETT
jgi:predicted PurR-regulated permease PerM